jgi:hypothetical protein
MGRHAAKPSAGPRFTGGTDTMKPMSFVVNVSLDGLVPLSEFSTLLPLRGIYVMSNSDQIIRVGESSSGMSRLKKGFRDPFRRTIGGKDKKNYIAYAWRTNYHGKPVKVDYFELQDLRFDDNYFRRSLEAELTFQFRIAYKRWPREMSEIHFLERFRNDSLLIDTATAILKHYEIDYQSSV